MRQYISRLAAFVLILGLFQLPAMAGDSAPEQMIKQTTDEVLATIKARSQEFKQDPAKLYAMVDEKVLPHFDFNRMTDLALGRYRVKVKGQQKPELVNEFRQLLVRTYGKALLEYNDQVIKFLPMRGSIDKGEVTIRTEIEQKGGFPIPLSYELYLKDGEWKVYDISVDNISLVTNYRASFGKKIKEAGVDALIKSLKDRNKQEAS
jgi:phospholipid transport system substrate-binding protein